jgi:hypothetical protein
MLLVRSESELCTCTLDFVGGVLGKVEVAAVVGTPPKHGDDALLLVHKRLRRPD